MALARTSCSVVSDDRGVASAKRRDERSWSDGWWTRDDDAPAAPAPLPSRCHFSSSSIAAALLDQSLLPPDTPPPPEGGAAPPCSLLPPLRRMVSNCTIAARCVSIVPLSSNSRARFLRCKSLTNSDDCPTSLSDLPGAVAPEGSGADCAPDMFRARATTTKPPPSPTRRAREESCDEVERYEADKYFFFPPHSSTRTRLTCTGGLLCYQ